MGILCPNITQVFLQYDVQWNMQFIKDTYYAWHLLAALPYSPGGPGVILTLGINSVMFACCRCAREFPMWCSSLSSHPKDTLASRIIVYCKWPPMQLCSGRIRMELMGIRQRPGSMEMNGIMGLVEFLCIVRNMIQNLQADMFIGCTLIFSSPFIRPTIHMTNAFSQ